MKKFGKLFLALFISIFCSISVVNAASKCSYDEQAKLNNLVGNIKVSYEEVEAKIDESLVGGYYGSEEEAVYYYFKVQVYNMTEDVYLKITNDVSNEVKYLNYDESQSGVVEFDWYDLDKVVNFKINVYSSNKTSCPNEQYRIIDLTLPRYNSYSKSVRCEDAESFYLCQRYITDEEEIDENTFYEKLTAFENKTKQEEEIKKAEENRNIFEKLSDFIEENKITVIVISTIIVLTGVVTTVMVIKKRRSRLI